MDKRSFFFGFGSALVIFAVLAYFFYSIQYKKLEDKFGNDYSTSADADSLPSETAGSFYFYNTMSPEVSSTGDASPNTVSLQTDTPKETTSPETKSAVEATDNDSYAVIEIKTGMISSDAVTELLKAGIISDGPGFTDFLVNNGYSKKLVSGRYTIKVGGDFKEIAEIISGRK